MLSASVAALRDNLEGLARGTVEETVSCEVEDRDGSPKTLTGKAAIAHIVLQLQSHTEVLGGLLRDAEDAASRMDEVAGKADSALAAASGAQAAAERAAGDVSVSREQLQTAERLVQESAQRHSDELSGVQEDAKEATGAVAQLQKDFGGLQKKVETALREMTASLGLLADALLRKGIISKDVADALTEEERRVGE